MDHEQIRIFCSMMAIRESNAAPWRRIKDRLYRNWVLKPALRLFRNTDRESHFWLLGPEVAHRDTICREIMLDGYYEKDLLAAMVKLVPDKNGTFLDIGANIGNHSIYLSKHFRRVISFEPIPRNCWIFKANRHLNRAHNITLVEKGLSSKSAQFYFGCEDPMQTNTGLDDSKNGSEDAQAVEVVRGDDALQVLGVSNVVGVKIDVEGHEPEVIRGLEAVLQRDHPIVFWEAFQSTTAAESADLLKTFGYRYFYHLGQQYARSNLIRSIKELSRSSVNLCSLQNTKYFTGLNVAGV
jgi:FkbM family methyltransferase